MHNHDKGTGHFIRQRVSGAINLVFTVFLIVLAIYLVGKPYGDIVAVIKNPLVAGGLIATLVMFAWHMQIGMQVIIEDYVHDKLINRLSLLASIGFCIFIALAGTAAVLTISFGA